MAVLIDASVLIEAERGRLDLEPYVAHRPDDQAFLSVITASELLHGVRRAAEPPLRAWRSAFVEGILNGFPVLQIDLATARADARVRADVVSCWRGRGRFWLPGRPISALAVEAQAADVEPVAARASRSRS